MAWLTILVSMLAQFFGPIIADWFKGLLERASQKMNDRDPNEIEDVIGELFDLAAGETAWYQFGRRAVLRVMRRVAIERGGEFLKAIAGRASAPQLNRTEASAIAAVMGL